MRQIQASEAKAKLAELLDDVERGGSVIITRHGRPIARLVPETEGKQASIARAIERLKTFRRTMPALALDELLAARHEGHRA
ncbi:MAG: type II toxin-antitoxin system prevent-host-death family antitoxin [Pseudomonadota bacterium]